VKETGMQAALAVVMVIAVAAALYGAHRGMR
jgi:hypothetical protein